MVMRSPGEWFVGHHLRIAAPWSRKQRPLQSYLITGKQRMYTTSIAGITGVCCSLAATNGIKLWQMRVTAHGFPEYQHTSTRPHAISEGSNTVPHFYALLTNY